MPLIVIIIITIVVLMIIIIIMIVIVIVVRMSPCSGGRPQELQDLRQEGQERLRRANGNVYYDYYYY